MSEKNTKPHSHSHFHSHSHSHAHGGVVGRMKFALVLNLIFAIIELVGGFWTNSVAILSDALHDLGDVLAMGTAIYLERHSHRKGDLRFSYGYRRFSVLGALITGLILIAGSAYILMEAIPRLLNPQQPHADGMIILGVLGVAVNGYAAYKVSHGSSLNEKMLMWHMLEDVVGWVVVLVGAIVMKFFEIPQLDAGLAIILSLWILYNVFKNIGEALRVFLMATPAHIDISEIAAVIRKVPKIEDVHHDHLWSLDGESHIYSAHIVLCKDASLDDMETAKNEVKKLVRQFGIIEATIETELSGTLCEDPEH